MKYLLLLFSVMLFANESGEEIAKKIEQAAQGVVGESSQMKMVLYDAYGETMTRELSAKSIEKEDGDKSVSKFISPADVKGTKLLTWENKDSSDNQWLYLPSLRRTKKISSRNKSSSYMGSEFTYEDLESQAREKFTHKLLREETLAPHGKVWVLEKVKKIKSSYSKIVSWVSQKYMTGVKSEFYDRKGDLLKVSTAQDFKEFKVKGKSFWRPAKITMDNKQNKKKSEILWVERKLGETFPLSEFDVEGLK